MCPAGSRTRKRSCSAETVSIDVGDKPRPTKYWWVARRSSTIRSNWTAPVIISGLAISTRCVPPRSSNTATLAFFTIGRIPILRMNISLSSSRSVSSTMCPTHTLGRRSFSLNSRFPFRALGTCCGQNVSLGPVRPLFDLGDRLSNQAGIDIVYLA